MKKTALTLALSATMLAGVANAATFEVNLTGASAQFNMWNDAASKFLESAPANCAAGSPVKVLADATHGFAKCTNGAGDTYIIRYTSNASYDGITALKGTQDPIDASSGVNCNGGVGTILRQYANDTTANGLPLVCKPTVVGASDVNAASFAQISKGLKLGPMGNPATDLGGVTATDNVYGPAGTATTNALTVISTDPTGLTTNTNHLAVPFAFYVNKAVTWNKCSATAAANANGFCTADADCGATIGACAPQTIDNLSRLQADLLFSGQITNWRDFGGYFVQKPVVLCLRHAGSGTHSTLDNAVMKSSWGKALTQAQKNNYAANGNQQTYNNYVAGPNSTTNLPFVWFNNGTSDMKKCINGQIFDTTTVPPAAQPARADIAAVGYMDADQPSTGNYVQIKYNGVTASRQALRNGWYDFFSMQNMYFNGSDTTNYTPVAPVVTALVAFASNPANIPAAEAGFWSTKGEMRVIKANDTTFPATKVTPTLPQTP
jgi:hypothetical protein